MGSSTFPDPDSQPAAEQPQLLGYAQITSNITGIPLNVITPLTGLSVTVSIPANRRIRVSSHIVSAAVTAQDALELSLWMDGASIKGSDITAVQAGRGMPIYQEVILTPAAGTHTFDARFRNINTTGSLIYAGSANPAFIAVEDITGIAVPAQPGSVPMGVLGYAVKTTAQTGIGASWTPITGLSVNVVVPAGRTLKATAHSHMQNTNVGGAGLSISLDGAGVGEGYAYSTHAGSGMEVVTTAVVSPSAGAHTFAVHGYALQGGTVTQHATAAIPAHLTVEDITATPVLTTTAPSSTLGYAETITPQSSILGTADLTGLSVSVTVPAGRRLRITGQSNFDNNSGAVNYVVFGIQRNGVAINDSVQSMNVTGGAGEYGAGTVMAIDAPAAGIHTYKLTAAASVSSIATIPTSARPGFILVEDITGVSTPIPSSTGFYAPANDLPVGARQGSLFYETDTDKLWAWNGTVWVELVRTGQWTDFTPVLTADGGGVGLGTGSQSYGRWTRMGRTIIGTTNIKFGTSGAAGGSGFYSVNLPVAARANSGGLSVIAGAGYIYNAGTGVVRTTTAAIDTNNMFMRIFHNQGTDVSLVSGTAPWTWTNNMEIYFNFTYEAAAST